MGETWQKTRLWAALNSREGKLADSMKWVISGLLPEVEQILSNGDSTPGRFTLHDVGHSWRVAEWMVDVAGENLVGLMDPPDLCLLLLSAYLHDIGMTPPVSKLDAHLDYLLSGSDDHISPDDVAELQAWLDDAWGGLVPPLGGKKTTSNDTNRARQIVAGYTRDRHNDWSEIWIRDNLSSYCSKIYPGWIDDLVLLCRSHHFGIDQLKGSAFSPRLVGSPAAILHLRYCACLLRVADVLDFDPERTPRILFAHRDVAESSAIFWHRDHELSFELDSGHILMHARPSDAITHHAIELAIDAVNRELLTARRLADETQFHRLSGRTADIPHSWRLETSVRDFVEPHQDRYEYVDGTFRPEPMKVLELVGGLELYESTIVAVRELLQNAFDAVREQIARQRLLAPAPATPGLYDELARTHRVELSLEQSVDGVFLTCSDSGAGMSKHLILSRFLIGGVVSSHETRELERTCVEHGFRVGRTARFGIGVLSYFLIASRLELRTRRSIEAGDPDGTGWAFTSTGLDDFGELRQDDICQTGTSIRFLVRPESMPGTAKEFAEELRDYLDDTVRKVPCPIVFDASPLGLEISKSEPGWTERTEEVRLHLLQGLSLPDNPDKLPSELLSHKQQRRIGGEALKWKELHQDAAEAFVCHVLEGELESGLGTYRIFAGHFYIDGCSSISFMDLRPLESGPYALQLIGQNHGYVADAALIMSWNGMRTHPYSLPKECLGAGTRPFNCVIEVDWTSDMAGRLAVHRNSVKLDENALSALEAVGRIAHTLLAEAVDSDESPFSLINSLLVGDAPAWGDKTMWLTTPTTGSAFHALSSLEFPRFDGEGSAFFDELNLTWRYVPASLSPTMSFGSRPHVGEVLTWHGRFIQPQAVGLIDERGQTRLAPIWTGVDSEVCRTSSVGLSAEFPPGWQRLAGMTDMRGRGNPITVWNQDHALWLATEARAWEWVWSRFAASRDPLPAANQLLRSPACSAAWIIFCLKAGDADLWNGLADRSPKFLWRIWDNIPGLAATESVLFWTEQRNGKVHILTRTGWEYSDIEAASSSLQDPPGEWWLTYSDGKHRLKPARKLR